MRLLFARRYWTRQWPARWGYLYAFLMVLALMTLRRLVTPTLPQAPFLYSALCVYLCAWFGGTAVGIFAISLIVSAVLAQWFLYPAGTGVPHYYLIKLVYFVLEWTAIAVLCGRFRRLHAAETRTREALQQRLAEREALLAELGQREAQLRLLIDGLPSVVAYIDRNYRYGFSNRAHLESHGLKREELAGKTVQDLLGEHVFADIRGRLQEAFSGHIVEFEKEQKHKDGIRNVRACYLPDLAPNGDVRGLIYVGVDITQERLVAAELRRAKEEAEQASAAKSAFLANVSHEIRTPLGVVLGFSELVMARVPRLPELAEWMSAIRRNTDLLSTLINDILDLAKVEAGRMELTKSFVSVSDILTDLDCIFRFQAESKGVVLSYECSPGVPQEIYTDPLRLRQVLFNIVGNAVKFTEKGAVTVKAVRSEDKQTGREALAFTVQDHGPGISERERSKLFQAFAQTNYASKRRLGGSGLGLALSKQLAQALGGDLVLEASCVGVGSTFTLTIDPGVLSSEETYRYAASATASGSLSEAQGICLHDLRLLLVEDSEDNRTLIKEVLNKTGAKVATATNGQEGLELALAADFDLVLMDLQMPVMDGYEATQTLRQKGYKKPIIALTAFAMRAERERCLASGFDEHLSKPLNRALLLQRIKDLALPQGQVLH